MPSVAELNALPYSGSPPSSKGLAAADFRKQYRLHGERVRWWKALPVPVGTPGRERNGYLYKEQVLDSEVKVMMSGSERDMQEAVFGAVASGRCEISVMPDEIHLARGDRILAMQRVHLSRNKLRRESGDTDVLPRAHATELLRVVGANRTFLVGTDCALSEDGSAVKWLSGGHKPQVGQEYAVEWKHRPMYVFLGQVNQEHTVGTDGLLLPQKGLLQLGENLPG